METTRARTLSRHSRASGAGRGDQGSEVDPSATRVIPLVGGMRIRVRLHGPVDVRIASIAGKQCGTVAREQLLMAGVSRGAIRRRLTSGRLERVHHGVYRLAGTAGVPFGDETAALLACGSEAVLSHHSAVTLWGLRPGTARPVHVTLTGKRGVPSLDGVIVHRSRTLTLADVRRHNRLSVTTPARALLDVSADLTDRDVERLLNEGLFALRILTRADIDDVLARAGSHSGRARLRRVATSHIPSSRTDSPPEEALLKMIRAAGLPEPRAQAYVLGYRLDFHWPELRLAVEVDTYGTHGSPARFDSDRRRDARLLTEKRIVVLRLTGRAIEGRPFEVLGLVARAIGQREAAAAV